MPLAVNISNKIIVPSKRYRLFTKTSARTAFKYYPQIKL
jgi:hypothetical protein